MPTVPQTQPSTPFGLPPPPPRSNGIPPPPMATPFMPSSAVMPPPAMNPMVPPPVTSTPPAEMAHEMGDNSAMQPPRTRKGMTAAQLYSLNAIGNGGVQQKWMMSRDPHPGRAPEGRAGTAASGRRRLQGKSPLLVAYEKPMKLSNPNDRINLNRIPHPEEDDHLRHVGWSTDDDYTGVDAPRFLHP